MVLDVPNFTAPMLIDFPMPDVNSDDLQKECDSSDANKYKCFTLMDPVEFSCAQGTMFGPNHRLLIALPVTIKSKTMVVPFLIDTTFPCCYMSKNALAKFGCDYEDDHDEIDATINGTNVSVHESSGFFEDVCMLGVDYLRASASKLTCVYSCNSFLLEKNAKGK
jgi:hypothetical protein